MSTQKTVLTVSASVNAPIQKVWQCWNTPEDIMQWNQASADWHCPASTVDLRIGGKFTNTMAAKDGSFSFDFGGTYDDVLENELIMVTLEDGRKWKTTFASNGEVTEVVESFEAEDQNPLEMQQAGWQAILNSFKAHCEKIKMQKIKFEITIAAPAQQVYSTMLADTTYRQWTAEFNPSSFYEGKWETGEKMLFVGINEAGKKEGMVSRIKEAAANKYVAIEHLGILQNEQEVTSGAAVEGWAGAMEEYFFTDTNGQTLLQIQMDANEDFKDYFESTWPKALEKLKSICESN